MNDGQSLYEVRILAPGPRPAFHLVAHHLWGVGCNFDSDGNARTAEDQNWTELTVELRSGASGNRVDIDPVSTDPLILAIRSTSADLCNCTADFINAFSGGTIER